MAQIPIFEASDVQDDSVRPTRIFLKEPRDEIPQALDRAGSALGEIGKNMLHQNQQNQATMADAAFETMLPNAKVKLGQRPFTSIDDHMATAQQLTDPSEFLKTYQQTHQLDPVVLRHLQGNLAIRQADFLKGEAGHALVLQHNKALGDLDTATYGYAQAAGHAGPDDFGLIKQKGLDAIKTAADTGALKPEEVVRRQQTFLHYVDLNGATGYALSDPVSATHMLVDPVATAKVYGSLSDKDRFDLIGKAHTVMTRADNAEGLIYKKQLSDAEKDWYAHADNGTLTTAYADAAVARFKELGSPYRAAFGRKPPTESDPQAFYSYMNAASDPEADRDRLESLKEHLKGDPNLSGPERAEALARVDSRMSGMRSPVEKARKDLSGAFDTSIWPGVINSLGGEDYFKYYHPGTEAQVKAQMKAAYFATFQDEDAPDKMRKAAAAFDPKPMLDNLPDSPTKSGGVPPPAYVPKPPAHTNPDLHGKLINVPIKLGG